MAIKTRIGKIHKVENKNMKKFSNENPYYFAAMVKDDEGTVFNILLTEAELVRAVSRAIKNEEDVLHQNLASKILD